MMEAPTTFARTNRAHSFPPPTIDSASTTYGTGLSVSQQLANSRKRKMAMTADADDLSAFDYPSENIDDDLYLHSSSISGSSSSLPFSDTMSLRADPRPTAVEVVNLDPPPPSPASRFVLPPKETYQQDVCRRFRAAFSMAKQEGPGNVTT